MAQEGEGECVCGHERRTKSFLSLRQVEVNKATRDIIHTPRKDCNEKMQYL